MASRGREKSLRKDFKCGMSLAFSRSITKTEQNKNTSMTSLNLEVVPEWLGEVFEAIIVGKDAT